MPNNGHAWQFANRPRISGDEAEPATSRAIVDGFGHIDLQGSWLAHEIANPPRRLEEPAWQQVAAYSRGELVVGRPRRMAVNRTTWRGGTNSTQPGSNRTRTAGGSEGARGDDRFEMQSRHPLGGRPTDRQRAK
jgi:hypothetical protein